MIIRSMMRCTVPRRIATERVFRPVCKVGRRYSTSASPSSSNQPPVAAMLGTFTNELDKIAPRFEINGSQIRVLKSPSEFYETLKAKILSAERRIFLSTLYIGKTEHELISTLRQALRAKPDLKLNILTDALRGTREAPAASCASLLAPLVTEFGPERVDIRMFHTPNLTGRRKKHIPKRINEGWGLQHMKLYGFDDEIILSGANLSSDYFTNRQDRYHVFSSKEMTNYFFNIQSAVSQLSFQVVPNLELSAGFTLEWPQSNVAPSPLQDRASYIKNSTKILSTLIVDPHQTSGISPNANTTVYPLSQFTSLLQPDTSTELPSVTSILRILSSPQFSSSSWTFTAGYFNPDPSLTQLLLSTSSSSNVVITASPEANGFYGSKGVSGLLPAAYTLLARRFLESVSKSPHASATILKEWRRGTVGVADGWTYHAKGLWVSLDGQKEPSISVVGSSNYTKRSYSLDLEIGAAIVTSDEGLKNQLKSERDSLQDYAQKVGMDDFLKAERRVGLQVRIAMWIVGLVGGAL